MIRLFINNIELDLDDSVMFPITFSQADAKNPEKRKRSSSKTIKMPGTKKNNKFFSSAYDLNISNVYGDLVGFEFDPTLRYPCLVTRNGLPIFRGTAHLTKVTTKYDVTNGRINTFYVVLYSNLANVFQLLGDIKVSELGWSEYDHILSNTAIQNSWTAPTGSGYWYPYIDFGFSQDPTSILNNQLRPYVYAKEIIEKCFEFAGFKVSSAFMNTTLFKKLTYGYGGGEPTVLSPTEITDREVRAEGNVTVSYNLNASSIEPNIGISKFDYARYILLANTSEALVIAVQDNLAQFNDQYGEIVIAHGGNYELRLTGDFTLTYAFSNPLLSGQDISIKVSWRVFVNGALVRKFERLVNDTSGGSTILYFAEFHNLSVNTGDIVSTDIEISTRGTNVSALATNDTFDITLNSYTLYNVLEIDLIARPFDMKDGFNVNISSVLPNQKAKDFLNDMITAFNLYMSDPDADNTVTIEPIDDYFYGTDDMDNWTDKLDRSSPIEIKPAANIEGKIYSFKFAQDRDYYKQLYYDTYGVDYGDFDYNVPSTFKKGDKKYQLKIAQSCPVQLEGTNIIIPRILKLNESTGVVSPHKGKPRMFLNNGVKSCTAWSLINSATYAPTVLTIQPIAHHLDSLTSATFDFNFGRPEVVYYDATTYTTNNLFYNYHAQFIRELTGRDSKLVNAWFNLNENDFYDNFMRRLCVIDGVAYRKNIIKDWSLSDNKLVKVELLKILKGNSRNTYTYNDMPPPLVARMNNAGDGTPITSNFTAKSSQTFYPVDTSAKDITVTLTGQRTGAPFSGLLPGKIIHIKKVSKKGKLIITPSGGKTIDGMTSVILKNKDDSLMIIYESETGNFKII